MRGEIRAIEEWSFVAKGAPLDDAQIPVDGAVSFALDGAISERSFAALRLTANSGGPRGWHSRVSAISVKLYTHVMDDRQTYA